MSAGTAARMTMAVISGLVGLVGFSAANRCTLRRKMLPRDKTRAPRREAGALGRCRSGGSTPVAEQAQQHEEQVDEVEIERERAHHRLAAPDGAVVHRVVHFLDALR